MHILQAARTVAGRQQRVLWIALAVADAAYIAAILRRLAAARAESDICVVLAGAAGAPVYMLYI